MSVACICICYYVFIKLKRSPYPFDIQVMQRPCCYFMLAGYNLHGHSPRRRLTSSMTHSLKQGQLAQRQTCTYQDRTRNAEKCTSQQTRACIANVHHRILCRLPDTVYNARWHTLLDARFSTTERGECKRDATGLLWISLDEVFPKATAFCSLCLLSNKMGKKVPNSWSKRVLYHA